MRLKQVISILENARKYIMVLSEDRINFVMHLVSNQLIMKSTGKELSRVDYQKHRFRLKKF